MAVSRPESGAAVRTAGNAAIGRVLRMAVFGSAAPALQQSYKPRQANGKVGFIGMGLFEV